MDDLNKMRFCQVYNNVLKKLKVPIAFYVLLILCNKAFLLILNGLML